MPAPYRIFCTAVYERRDKEIESLECDFRILEPMICGYHGDDDIPEIDDSQREEVPEEDGIYCVTGIYKFTSCRSYDGEYDSDMDVLEENVHKLSAREEKDFLELIKPTSVPHKIFGDYSQVEIEGVLSDHRFIEAVSDWHCMEETLRGGMDEDASWNRQRIEELREPLRRAKAIWGGDEE